MILEQDGTTVLLHEGDGSLVSSGEFQLTEIPRRQTSHGEILFFFFNDAVIGSQLRDKNNVDCISARLALPQMPFYPVKNFSRVLATASEAASLAISTEFSRIFSCLLNSSGVVISCFLKKYFSRRLKLDLFLEENIFFIGGRPCLGDISLLAEDSATITRRGTPGYAAPSWYLETAGNPDMWGLATTLYTMITGNSPDKLGRGAFLWPPQGEKSVDSESWNAFHSVIFHATHEKASERFLRFQAFAEALSGVALDGVQEPPLSRLARSPRVLWGTVGALGLCVALAVFVNFGHRGGSSSDYEKKLTVGAEEFEVILREARRDLLEKGNLNDAPLPGLILSTPGGGTSECTMVTDPERRAPGYLHHNI